MQFIIKSIDVRTEDRVVITQFWSIPYWYNILSMDDIMLMVMGRWLYVPICIYKIRPIIKYRYTHMLTTTRHTFMQGWKWRIPWTQGNFQAVLIRRWGLRVIATYRITFEKVPPFLPIHLYIPAHPSFGAYKLEKFWTLESDWFRAVS